MSSGNISGTVFLEGTEMWRIAVDPGHGGDESGAVGRSGLQEKDVNLDVARKIRQYLLRRGLPET